MATEKDILAALSQVEDPDLKRDIVSLGMVKDLKLASGRVFFTVELTTPACPLKEAIHNACVTAIHTLVDPGLEVHVTMSARVTAGTAPGTTALPGVKNVILVGSGKGGVGKSTVAANLALALSQLGSRVGLLDADIYGPSLPTLFELVDEKPYMETVEGKDYMVPVEKHGLHLMSIGFLVEADKAIVWRGPMASNALRQLFADTRWPDLDYLIADMPPGTGDIQITLCQQLPVTGALLVTTPHRLALADARKAAGMFVSPQIRVPLLGIVENMAWFETDKLPGEKFYIFGKQAGQQLSQEFASPVLVQIPLLEDMTLADNTSQALALTAQHPLHASYRVLAGELARQVSIRNAGPLQPQKA
ncbi:MAG: Mrp/NBP35 family ATP-binding protein [Bacteroidetes bacterium]|nr:Mrp/NBP35 family ATP-binding protein [Bacteroidota bacterium]